VVTKSNFFSKLKSALKKVAFLVAAKRCAYRYTYLVAKAIFGFCRRAFFHPLMRFETIRQLVFDTTPVDTLLSTKCGSETFVVSSRDTGVGRMLVCHGLLDYKTLETVIAILGPNFSRDLLVDVGANIGSICVPAVSRGVFKRAIAVEPAPDNFSLLSTNISVNNVADRISTYNFALGSQNGEHVTFELAESNFGDHRIRTRSDAGLYEEDKRKTLSVRSETLDSIAGKLDPENSLIWMDTQGYEGHILKGARTALSSRIPLVIEFWPYGMNRSESYLPLKAALLESNYEWFYDLSDPEHKLRLSEDSLDRIYSKLGEFGKFTDLLIV